jgi:alpha-D-ribose 1-methylphosphonate 5-triphosphate synthase subunit PhnG
MTGETMAEAAADPAVAARQHWLAVLAKAGPAELEAAWEALADKPAYRLLRGGETGLVMLRGREMTMTRAAVQLLDAAGLASHTGFGHVAGRSTRHAELVALFDALLQDPARHDAVFAGAVAPLAVRQQAAKDTAAGKAMASKVEFLTMVRGE